MLPLAIRFGTALTGQGKLVDGAGTVELISDNVGKKTTLSRGAGWTPMVGSWTNYVIGVVREFEKDLPEGKSMELKMAIAGDVPLGSGLSSSASLEVATARFLEAVFEGCGYGHLLYTGDEDVGGRDRSDPDSRGVYRAVRCQRAENSFCDSPCGIMDQYVSSCGLKDNLLLIDCEDNSFKPVPFDGSRIALIVANSNVKHSIAGGEYPQRVIQCEEATKAVCGDRLKNLRHATMSDLTAAKGKLSDVAYSRAEHVIGENARTVEAVSAFRAGDYGVVGKCMAGSHLSLDKKFEVSCPELNMLQEIAMSYPVKGVVLGSRMTGGGFGGCTVTLVRRGHEEKVREFIESEYRKQSGVECHPFVTGAEEGARLVKSGGQLDDFVDKYKLPLLVGFTAMAIMIFARVNRK